MTLSLPSAFAAAISASMPPQAEADAAVFALPELHAPVPPPPLLPHAATTNMATTARPRPRIELRTFILRSPPEKPGRGRGNQLNRAIMATAGRRCKDTVRACR